MPNMHPHPDVLAAAMTEAAREIAAEQNREGNTMSMDYRVSGLDVLTTDAIGACAIIAVHEDGADGTPGNPDMTTVDRLTYLRRRMANVEAAANSDGSSLERALLLLAASAGLWVDGMTTIQPEEDR